MVSDESPISVLQLVIRCCRSRCQLNVFRCSLFNVWVVPLLYCVVFFFVVLCFGVNGGCAQFTHSFGLR